jgi:hypothetical protein
MGTQGYRANYREAFECANCQLEEIYSAYHELQLRKEQLECAVAALGPFLKSARVPAREETHRLEPVRLETVSQPQAIPEPLQRSESVSDEAITPAVPEPVVAPSYAPVSDASIDPIQARINHALGLAVA